MLYLVSQQQRRREEKKGSVVGKGKRERRELAEPKSAHASERVLLRTAALPDQPTDRPASLHDLFLHTLTKHTHSQRFNKCTRAVTGDICICVHSYIHAFDCRVRYVYLPPPQCTEKHQPSKGGGDL